MATRRASASAPLLSFEEAGFGVPTAEEVAAVESPAPAEGAEGGYVPPPEVAQAFERQRQRKADRAAQSAEQERLEAKHGKLATVGAKLAEGVLDAVTAPGALWAASHELQGSLIRKATGWGGLEEFARGVGEAAQGKEALADLQFLFGGGDLDRYDQQRKELDEQQKAWPMLSSVSKLAGQAAVGVATGGATAATGAAPGILKAAVIAGAEGGGVGAQQQYAEGAPLRDVLTGALTGAALSAAIGGGATAAVKGAGKSWQLAKEAFEGADGERFANERALKAFGPRGADIRKLRTEEKVQQLGRDARTYKLADGRRLIEKFDSAEDLAPKVAQAVEETGSELQALRKRVIDSGTPIDARAFLRRADDEVINPLLASSSPTIRAKGQRAAAELADLRARVQDLDDSVARTIPESELARRVESAEMDVLRARDVASRDTFREVEMARSRLLDARERLGSARDAVDRATVQAEVKEAEKAFGAARKAAVEPHPAVVEAERKLSEAHAAAANPVKQAPPITYADLLEQQRALRDVAFPDKGPAQGITLTPEHAKEAAQLNGILENMLEQHVDDVLKAAEPQLAGRYKEVRRMTESFIKLRALNQKAIANNLGNRAVSLTDYMTALTGANLAGGPAGFVGGLAIAGAHKFARERGSSFLANLYTEGLDNVVADSVGPAVEQVMKVARPVARAGLATARQAAPRAAAAEVSHGIGPLVGGGSFASTEEYNKHLDRLNELTNSLDDVTAGLADVPGSNAAFAGVVGTEYKQKIGRLLQDLPKPKPNPRGKAYETLSRGQLKLAADMWEATFAPDSIFDDFSRGTVSYDKVKYVWKQYPGWQLAAQAAVQDVLSAQMSDDEKADIPDALLTQIDFLLGYRGELQGSLSPRFSLTMSQAGALQGADPEQQPMELPSSQTYTQRVAAKM
jgi:hypothetical protein